MHEAGRQDRLQNDVGAGIQSSSAPCVVDAAIARLFGSNQLFNGWTFPRTFLSVAFGRRGGGGQLVYSAHPSGEDARGMLSCHLLASRFDIRHKRRRMLRELLSRVIDVRLVLL